MGLLDKIRGMVNGGDDGYASDTEVEPMYDDEEAAPLPQNKGVSIDASAIELKVVKPDSYINSRQIADHLLCNRTIVLNLEATNKETAIRILDFLSGVTYSINGQLKRVANNTYILTPNNVNVSADQMRNSASVQETEAPSSKAVTDRPQPQPASFSGDTLY